MEGQRPNLSGADLFPVSGNRKACNCGKGSCGRKLCADAVAELKFEAINLGKRYQAECSVEWKALCVLGESLIVLDDLTDAARRSRLSGSSCWRVSLLFAWFEILLVYRRLRSSFPKRNLKGICLYTVIIFRDLRVCRYFSAALYSCFNARSAWLPFVQFCNTRALM